MKPSIEDSNDAVELDISRLKGHIQFKDVYFGYSKERQILKGLTIDIPEGKTVAIVGSSGCGKSTLLRLLYRFYNVDSGSITIDGQDITKLKMKSLRHAIGVVPQDTVLFNDSIAYNIGYGEIGCSEETVVAVAKKAKLHDAIMRMPKGYDTVVGERGLKLSGGEKQRVSIARAMLKNAPILLCDEATSALDTETENDIMQHMHVWIVECWVWERLHLNCARK